MLSFAGIVDSPFAELERSASSERTFPSGATIVSLALRRWKGSVRAREIYANIFSQGQTLYSPLRTLRARRHYPRS